MALDKVENLGNLIEMIGDETQENEDILLQVARQLSLKDNDRFIKNGILI